MSVSDEVQIAVAEVAEVPIDELAAPRLTAIIPGTFGKTSEIRVFFVDFRDGRCALVFHEDRVGEHVDVYPTSEIALDRYSDAISLLAWCVWVGEEHGLWRSALETDAGW